MDVGAAKTIGSIVLYFVECLECDIVFKSKNSNPMDVCAAKTIGSIVLEIVYFLEFLDLETVSKTTIQKNKH